MNRKSFLKSLVAGLLGAPVLAGARHAAQQAVAPLRKSKQEWRKLLSKAQYAVLFEEDTEYPGTSALLKEHRKGTFVCAACYLPLFDAGTKFEIGKKRDFKIGYPRTEYHCARCGGHQGHIFDDGPPPTGLRYCNNGVALYFVPAGKTLKLRFT